MRKKKIWMVSILCILILAGCEREKLTTIEALNIGLVPSSDTENIEEGFTPLEEILKSKLSIQGYEVENINLEVGESYEEVGTDLATGVYDIAFLPAGTLVENMDNGAEAILVATRDDLSIDSESPLDWNVEPTTFADSPVTFYRSLIIAGPSEDGREMAQKVEDGELLDVMLLKNATWCLQSSNSSAGFIYPSLWLSQNYNSDIYDLLNTVKVNGYDQAIKYLDEGKCDIAPIFADARQNYSYDWQGISGDIWSDTSVIAVTDPIINDAIAISRNSKYYNEDFIEALQSTFIDLGKTEVGLNAISIYGHTGYQIATNEDYESESELFKEIKQREVENLE